MNTKIELLPHNEEAYEKLTKFLEKEQMASINHATGTGKSFIILKYLFENKDKRILYLAPTYQIIDQLIREHKYELNIPKDAFAHFDTMIYRSLIGLDMNDIANKYDIIVLDEYHRCGSKKWGEQVQELLKIIKSDYPNTKVIGTTATEIRYLDNMKNMNEILFEGKTASELSLSDAIVKGILPVPIYVSLVYDFYDEMSKIERRIKRNVVDDEIKNEYLKELYQATKQLDNIVKKSINIDDYIDRTGKFLVFSSNTSNIENDKKIIHNILKNNDTNDYIVSYYNKPQKNNEIIRKFRQSNSDEANVLYSINLLNEGVHIKGIDAIFMLRPTISPIIYFQQIGRLLSYSKRKDKVVVMDLVNNIKNNEAMYSLYSETIKKAKDLLKTDPENKVRYEYIINTLNFVDKTSNVSKILDDLNKKYSYESLIIDRLKRDVKYLKNLSEYNSLWIQAQTDIFKYQKYITLELFEQIQKLDVEKPELFDLSLDEYKNKLCGCKNINEYLKKKTMIIEYRFNDYYDKNNKIPSVFSNDKEESNLAKDLVKNYYSLSNKTQKMISSNITENYSLFEKISYNSILGYIDIVRLKKEIALAITNKIPISVNMINALSRNNDVESSKLLRLLKMYQQKEKLKLDAFDTLINQPNNYDKLQKKYNVSKNILLHSEFAVMIEKIYKEYQATENKDIFIERLSLALQKFVAINKRLPKYDSFDLKEKKLFIEKALFNDELSDIGFDEKIQEIFFLLNQKKEEQFINEVASFMNANNGKLPYAKSTNPEERKLSLQITKRSGKINYSNNKTIADIVQVNEEKRKDCLNRYLMFITINGRRPLDYSCNEEEKELYKEFEQYKYWFTDEEKQIVKDATKHLSSYKEHESLYNELLRAYPKYKMEELQNREDYALISSLLKTDKGSLLIDEEELNTLYKDNSDREKVLKIMYDYSIILRKGVMKK